LLIAALLLLLIFLIALGTLVGKFFGGRGIILLGLAITLGVGWMSYRLINGVRAGRLHPDDGLVVYVFLAVFVVMTLVFASCYGVLLAKGKLPRHRD